MKKYLSLIAVVLAALLLFASCGNKDAENSSKKEAKSEEVSETQESTQETVSETDTDNRITELTADNYVNALLDKGLHIQNVTSDYDKEGLTDYILIAVDPDSGLQIEAFFFKKADDAKATYEHNKQKFDDVEGGNSFYSTIGNISKYSKATDEKFMRLALKDTVFLYCDTAKSNSEQANEIFGMFGLK